jgi:hypothetical protein
VWCPYHPFHQFPCPLIVCEGDSSGVGGGVGGGATGTGGGGGGDTSAFKLNHKFVGGGGMTGMTGMVGMGGGGMPLLAVGAVIGGGGTRAFDEFKYLSRQGGARAGQPMGDNVGAPHAGAGTVLLPLILIHFCTRRKGAWCLRRAKMFLGGTHVTPSPPPSLFPLSSPQPSLL